MYCVLCTTTTSTPHHYSLSLHDALPISDSVSASCSPTVRDKWWPGTAAPPRSSTSATASSFAGQRCTSPTLPRSEEHTSELQSPCNLVCRLLLEKKKKRENQHFNLSIW